LFLRSAINKACNSSWLTVDGQSSRLEQAEDRISELEDERVIKGKTKEVLIKQLKTCIKENARTY
jgi:hypothetical protein